MSYGNMVRSAHDRSCQQICVGWQGSCHLEEPRRAGPRQRGREVRHRGLEARAPGLEARASGLGAGRCLLQALVEALHVAEDLDVEGLDALFDGRLDAALHLALAPIGAEALLRCQQLLRLCGDRPEARRIQRAAHAQGVRASALGDILAVQAHEVGKPSSHALSVALHLDARIFPEIQNVDRLWQLLLVQDCNLILGQVQELKFEKAVQILEDADRIALQRQELQPGKAVQVLDSQYPVVLQVQDLGGLEGLQVGDIPEAAPLDVQRLQRLRPLQGLVRVEAVVLEELALRERLLHDQPQRNGLRSWLRLECLHGSGWARGYDACWERALRFT
mmetsp:Transcript_51358/g.166505  ORF Transcript_51358/g.166505 Transcript_51358/m.166505 type:complete len:334 (+) Transcript_51358:3-1004(+)